MTTAADQTRKFFVIHGPVQPDQPCYVAREADALLEGRLREGDYCHVLAPPQTGKTSLVAQAARRLLGAGVRVAILDLVDIGSRHVADDPPRWYYSLAYRVVRELRIRSDMNAWWQERSGLTVMQRLRDFFLELVLAEVRQPVVIFIDRLEAIADQRVAWELLDAIRACFDARVTTPEFRRLAFALVGEVGAARALPAGPDSPFAISTPISLGDFTPEQVRELCRRGLELPAQDVAPLAERVWYWTGGHPYLVQKTLRALARRPAGGRHALGVDETVAQLFFTRNAIREEPHLATMAERLRRPGPRRVARLTLYGRIRKGLRVVPDRNRPEHRELLDAGLVVEADGRFALRNRIYAQAFTAYWVNQNLPFGWKGAAAAVLAALFVLTAPVWYGEWLPAPYVRILAGPGQDFVAAQDAWRRLRRLPGFATTADNLFLDHLSRQSQRARSLGEVQRIGERMQQLPGGTERAELLLGQFWDRRSNLMAQRGDRDGALMYRLKSLQRPTREREQRLAELLGEDLPRLVATIRTTMALRAVELDVAERLLVTLDEANELQVWRLGEGTPRREQRLSLTAEEIQPLQRRATQQRVRFAKRLTLAVRLDHPRPADVEVILQAPSGRQAVLRLDEAARGGPAGTLRFDSARNWMLLPLLEQSAAGTWTAWFSDTRQGAAGRLLGWELRLDGELANPPAEATAAALAIPEPQTTPRARAALGPAGRRALTWPADSNARGDLLVWDVARGEVIARLPRPAALDTARFVLGHAAVLIESEREAVLREVAAGKLIGRLQLAPGARPEVAEGGRYLAAPTVTRDGANALTVWDLRGLRPIGQIVTGEAANVTAVDPLGRYVAIGDDAHFVRIWSVRDQALLAECEHAAPPARIQLDARGRWLATQDVAHRLQLWSIEAGCEPTFSRPGAEPWLLAFAPDMDLLIAGNYGRGFTVLNPADGKPAGPVLQPGMGGAGAAPPAPAAQPKFFPALRLALTYDGRKALKIWSPPLPGGPAAAGPARGSATESFAASPDGRVAAVGLRNGDVRLLPLQEASVGPVAENDLGFIGHRSAVTRVVFDESGKWVASGSLEGTLRVWDTASGAPRPFFGAYLDEPVRDVAFAADGRYVAVAGRSTLVVVDASSGATLARTSIQAEAPVLVLSPDGESVFIGGDREGITRWDWRTNRAVNLAGAEFRIRRLARSPEGQLLVTASADRVVRLWRPAAGSPLRRTFTPGAQVDGLWFLDERRLLVQAGAWLHSLAVEATGLEPVWSRLLPGGDTLAQPLSGGHELLLVEGAFSTSPTGRRLPLGGSWAPPLTQPVPRIAAALGSSLQLTVNEAGEIRPLGTATP